MRRARPWTTPVAAILAASAALACGSEGGSSAGHGVPSGGSPSAIGGGPGVGGAGSSATVGGSAAGSSASSGASGGSVSPSSGGAPAGSSATGGAAAESGGVGAGASGGPAAESGPDEIPEALAQALATASASDAAALTAAYPLQLESTLGYDPRSAAGLDSIQGSALALTDGELDKLGANGFVISTAKKFPTFAYGYRTIYLEDLPVYVSADAILNAAHHAFDDLLMAVEVTSLSKELDQLLQGMRDRLVEASFDPVLRADLDLYLTLAHSLLKQERLEPSAGADPERVQAMYDLAIAASGRMTVSWFGKSREEDFSQFRPRGHYTRWVELQRYFRAMMLLGRVDLRLVETQADGSQVFNRAQFDAAVALRDLLDEAARERLSYIDWVIGSFVGERDAMALPELDGLLAALGVDGYEAARALDDRRIVDEIARGGWGAQRIASRIIVKGANDGRTLPPDRSFALFPQRYTVDSHVFVNTTYDRVEGRMMPDPLDVAFAALGNSAALPLLASGLTANASYAGGLAKSRVLVDAHEPAYWDGSLYTMWLSALRAMSPSEATLAQLPSVARTEAFQRRVLSTQLASWAELRHDTILYAKQSYSTGGQCEFPDAYVDPYPELYARLGRFAERMGEIAASLPESAVSQSLLGQTDVSGWARTFKTAMGYLERMAQNQLTGMPHSEELLAFVNEAVNWSEHHGCGPVLISNLTGWYTRLFLSPSHVHQFDPTIADVHTQPMDESGAEVGRILHVGTGHPRLMVVTVETCEGPRAYAGLASSYAEVIEGAWTRLTDKDWANRLDSGPFPDVPWMKPLLAE